MQGFRCTEIQNTKASTHEQRKLISKHYSKICNKTSNFCGKTEKSTTKYGVKSFWGKKRLITTHQCVYSLLLQLSNLEQNLEECKKYNLT